MNPKQYLTHWLLLAFGLLVVVLLWPVSVPADYQAGLYAYERADYKTAYREWLSLAEQGDARAQFELGTLYDDGKGVARDDAEAVKWYRRATEHGYDLAQYTLGMSYYIGEGVPQDYIQAYAWFNLARLEANISDTKLNAGSSTGRCNTGLQFIRRSFKPQRFSWPLI